MAEGFAAALRARVLAEPGDAAARAAARAVADLGGEGVAGVIFFGSRKSEAGFDRHSAWDFFLVTRSYRPLYSRLRASGRLAQSARLVAALNAVLPPNQLRLELALADGGVTAKCAVIGLGALERATSRRRQDHFCAGRLFQPVEIVYAADPESRERMLAAVESAHRETWSWIRPWLGARFDADDYYRTLLRVSLSGEIRPESSRRAAALWEAQREHRRAVYPLLLAELCDAGELVPAAAGGWSVARPPGGAEIARLRLYFAVSKLRATVRWLKYMVTFDGWLDYIVHKVERHTGREVKLTPSQRRYPLLLLWPAVFRHLREKDKLP